MLLVARYESAADARRPQCDDDDAPPFGLLGVRSGTSKRNTS